MTISAKKLQRFVLLTCALGVLLPLLTLVLKASADDFLLWKQGKNEVGWIAGAVETAPLLDLERYPALSDWSWHRAHRPRSFSLYARYGATALLFLLLALTMRKRLASWLSRVEKWAAQSDHSRERKLIVWCCCGLFFVFVTKLSLGFIGPGISGWTYENRHTKLLPELPDGVQVFTDIPEEFEVALNPDANYTAIGSGYLKGRAQYFHLKDGSILPFNDGLSGYVFPNVVFVRELIPHGSPQVYLKAVKHGLTSERERRGFLLPKPPAYPRHTAYMPIDYSTYPPESELVKISDWTVWLRIDSPNRVEFVSATLENEAYYDQ